MLDNRVLPDGSHGAPATTRFPLPPLKPPSDGLIALLDAPTTARLHTPAPLRLTVRNRHPTRSINITVQLGANPADLFVVAGLRHGRIPILLPDVEKSVTWNLFPIDCALVNIPTVKVLDRRSAVIVMGQSQPHVTQAEGDEGRIVDVRWEGRKEASGDEKSHDEQLAKAQDAYVLVLP